MDYCVLVGPHTGCKLSVTFTGWKMARFWTGRALYDVMLTITPPSPKHHVCAADIFQTKSNKIQLLKICIISYNLMDCRLPQANHMGVKCSTILWDMDEVKRVCEEQVTTMSFLYKFVYVFL